MGRKTRNIILYGVLGCFGVLFVAAGFGYWRISQGPVTIGFLSGPLENFINASLDGMRIRVRDAVIERDPVDNTVQLRLREAQLEDLDGQLIARAPRAAVGLSGSALLSGELQPERLELIGPRILVRRTIDGRLELGFGEAADEDAPIDATDPGFSVDEETVTKLEGEGGGILADTFRRFVEASGGDGAASRIESISVTDAAVSIYDEVNEAIWYAPNVNLVFQRVPYGMSLLAYGEVASGRNPWHLQIAADYIAETQRFKATMKIADFVPADIADEVFILSDLAKVEVPLTGEAQIEFDQDGTIYDAHAVLAAGAGHVGFPRYISQSLLVDEGEFFLTYVPEDGSIAVEESALYVGGSRATINGRLVPVRDESGAVQSLHYELLAQNVSLDTEGTRNDQLSIDRFELRGLAAIEEGRLDVERLALRAGDANIEIRGTFLEGPEVPAVFLRGSMNDIPLPILMKLWPPDAAPDARAWIIDHVTQGTVSEARLSVNLQSQALAAALQDTPIPNDQFTLTFRLEDVTTSYFEDLPPLEDARGEGILRGNELEVRMSEARVNLDSGQHLSVTDGRFFVQDLMRPGTIGQITAQIDGETSAVLRVIDEEPLRYASAAGVAPHEVGGMLSAHLDFRLPMLSDVPFEQVELGATAQLTDITYPGAFDGGDIQGGEATLEIDKQGLNGRGDLVINGVGTNVRWTEDFNADPSRSMRVEARATLSERDRDRLGIDLSSFLSGPMSVHVTAAENEGALERLHFDADLSRAQVFVDAIGWRRPGGEGAKAAFDLDLRNRNAVRVTNLLVEGPDHLNVEGDLTLNGNGELAAVNMPVVQLGAGNRFSLTGRRNDSGGLDFNVEGDSFDARPLVGSVFQERDGSGGTAGGTGLAGDSAVTLQARVRTMFLHNHAHLSSVNASLVARSGAIQQMQLTGLFPDSRPMDVTVTPQSNGDRTLVVQSGNAGAVLRAVDLYSRVQGGTLKLEAVLGEPNTGEFRSGRLRINSFEVIDEPALTAIAGSVQQHGNSNRQSSRSSVNVTAFDRMQMSFVIDATHFRIVDEAIVYGPTVGSSARGTIGRGDGSLNLAGTLTPAYALNAALGNLPILGQALMGGQGQGLVGITFAVTGTMQRPRVTVNPVSALAPGFLKRIFEFDNSAGTRNDGSTSFEAQQFESDSRAPRFEAPER